MNIGDYVRSKYYGICRIINIISDAVELNRKDSFGRLGVFESKDNIINYSSNIIDLIEVGDYVNGMKITNIWFDKETNNIEFEFDKKESYLYVKEWDYESRITKYKLKSIVTKEQFESMEYKL